MSLHFYLFSSDKGVPGVGNGNPLQYSCLENPMNRRPGGLQSIGLHRVGHDWSYLAWTHDKGVARTSPVLWPPFKTRCLRSLLLSVAHGAPATTSAESLLELQNPRPPCPNQLNQNLNFNTIPMDLCVWHLRALTSTLFSYFSLHYPEPMNFFWAFLLEVFGRQLRKVGGFSRASDGKEYTCNAGDLSLIFGSERSAGEGNGYPLQYSCLENSMDRGVKSLKSLGSAGSNY